MKKHLKFKILISFVLFLCANNLNAQRVIPLYEGVAPGSENWNWEEKQIKSGEEASIIYNVVVPTLTVFPADPETANALPVVKSRQPAKNRMADFITCVNLPLSRQGSRKRIDFFGIRF